MRIVRRTSSVDVNCLSPASPTCAQYAARDVTRGIHPTQHDTRPTKCNTNAPHAACDVPCGIVMQRGTSAWKSHPRLQRPLLQRCATSCVPVRICKRYNPRLGRTTWGVWCTLWVLCEYSACTACVLCERCGTTRLAEPLGVVAAVLAVDRTGDEYHRRRPKAVKEAWRSVRACTWVCCFVCCAILLVVMFVGRRPGSKSVSTVG